MSRIGIVYPGGDDMGSRFELLRMENDRPVEPGEDDRFLLELQSALLLALQENGMLTQTQCRLAAEKLCTPYGRAE